MPCRYDPSPDECAAAEEAAHKVYEAREGGPLDVTTRLLCEAVQLIPKDKRSPALQAWARDHHARDVARLERELKALNDKENGLFFRHRDLDHETSKTLQEQFKAKAAADAKYEELKALKAKEF